MSPRKTLIGLVVSVCTLGSVLLTTSPATASRQPYPITRVVGPDWPDHFVTDISVDGQNVLVRRNEVSAIFNRSTRATRRLAITVATDLSGNGRVVHAVNQQNGGAPIREIVGTRTARPMTYAFPRRSDWSAASIDSDWTGRYVAIGADNGVFASSSIFLVDTKRRTRVDVGARLGDVRRRQFSAPSISADGRYTAFSSSIDFGPSSVHVYDRVTRTFRSVPAGDGSHQAPTISADGTAVAFYSSASTLVSGTTPGATRLYLHDFSAGRTSLVSSVLPEAPFGGPVSLSADGDRVAHVATAPVQYPGQPTMPGDNVVMWENGVSRVVTVDKDGGAPNGRTPVVTMSDDGTAIAFASTATDLTGSPRSGVFVARLPSL
jgi:Tol biopolymer transport system component